MRTSNENTVEIECQVKRETEKALLIDHGGEQLDPESKLPHLAHAVCCLLFILWFEETNG